MPHELAIEVAELSLPGMHDVDVFGLKESAIIPQPDREEDRLKIDAREDAARFFHGQTDVNQSP